MIKEISAITMNIHKNFSKIFLSKDSESHERKIHKKRKKDMQTSPENRGEKNQG